MKYNTIDVLMTLATAKNKKELNLMNNKEEREKIIIKKRILNLTLNNFDLKRWEIFVLNKFLINDSNAAAVLQETQTLLYIFYISPADAARKLLLYCCDDSSHDFKRETD